MVETWAEPVTIETDWLEFAPRFYWAQPDRLTVGTVAELLAAGAPTTLDDDAVAAFLRLGFYVGDDSPFQAIRALPPGGSLTWQPGSAVAAGGPTIVTEQPADRGEAIAEYQRLFAQAVERCPDGIVSLSGGRDSRHIILELARQGRTTSAVSIEQFPPRSNEDADVAAVLAGRLGIRHERLAQQREQRVALERDKNRRLGYLSDEFAWYLPLADAINARNVPVYDGIGGDVLSAGLFVTEERLRLIDDPGRLAAAMAIADESVYRGLLADYERWSAERAFARIAREYEQHAHAANPIGSFYFWNRTRREVALGPFTLLDQALTPYLDRELVEFLASLPLNLVADHTFHTDTISVAYPDMTDVPYAAEEGIRRSARYSTEAASAARHLLRGTSEMIDRRWLASRLVLSAGRRSAMGCLSLAIYLRDLESAA